MSKMQYDDIIIFAIVSIKDCVYCKTKKRPITIKLIIFFFSLFLKDISMINLSLGSRVGGIGLNQTEADPDESDKLLVGVFVTPG